MAEFLIREIEGMRQVQLDIQDETVQYCDDATAS